MLLDLYLCSMLRKLCEDMFQGGNQEMEPEEEHEKRIVLETIVGLLPRERNAVSISFLSMLMRAAMFLDTTVACRLDLQDRMGIQLEQAALDDILFPSSYDDDTLLDIDTVQMILVGYLENKVDASQMVSNTDDHRVFSQTTDMERVGRLMESYLAEIATDPNLAVPRLISLANSIPDQARVTDDGMYRAIDIYLKVHPFISEIERKDVCSLIDTLKLSREACAHAAQNERLPVEMVVQILFDEQKRLQEAANPAFSQKTSSHVHEDKDNLKRENDDLKLQLLRMKDELQGLEKPSGSASSINKPPLPKKSFVSSVTRKLGRLYPFMPTKPSEEVPKKPRKDRRHSVS